MGRKNKLLFTRTPCAHPYFPFPAEESYSRTFQHGRNRSLTHYPSSSHIVNPPRNDKRCLEREREKGGVWKSGAGESNTFQAGPARNYRPSEPIIIKHVPFQQQRTKRFNRRPHVKVIQRGSFGSIKITHLLCRRRANEQMQKRAHREAPISGTGDKDQYAI